MSTLGDRIAETGVAQMGDVTGAATMAEFVEYVKEAGETLYRGQTFTVDATHLLIEDVASVSLSRASSPDESVNDFMTRILPREP